MDFLHKLYIYVSFILILISCKPSSKINTDDVKNLISKIENCNQKNEYDKSLEYLRTLDSIYNKDVEVKKKYLQLLKETNKYNLEYTLNTFSDSLLHIDDSINLFVKNHNVAKIDDSERNENYYVIESKVGVVYNGLDFSIRLNQDATFDILTNMIIKSKDAGYNSISLSNGKDSWNSKSIGFEDSDNYTYEFEGKYMETVRFSVSDMNKLKDIFANSSKISICFYGNGNKLIMSKKLSIGEIDGYRNLFILQEIISKQFYYKYKIDNAKKRLLKSI